MWNARVHPTGSTKMTTALMGVKQDVRYSRTLYAPPVLRQTHAAHIHAAQIGSTLIITPVIRVKSVARLYLMVSVAAARRQTHARA